jgi:hypothetical protein
MFLILATGIALWIAYGSLIGDLVIIVANSISLCLLSGILYFKLREEYRPTSPQHSATALKAAHEQSGPSPDQWTS